VKTLILSNSDLEGGAAKAAYRLHKGLGAAGVDSYMLVQQKTSTDLQVLAPHGKLARGMSSLRPTLDLIPLYLAGKAEKKISPAWLPDDLSRRARTQGADVVNLHAIRKGSMRLESLRVLPTPLVWTLHDMWAFTGGCHYDLGCGRYQQRCGACPVLDSHKENDLSRWIWSRKARTWRALDFTVVCPSRWLANCAATSSLFHQRRIHVIPNGLDTQRYRPTERGFARDWFGLPAEKKIVLFGAANVLSNPLKGFDLLAKALALFAGTSLAQQIELAVVGAEPGTLWPDLPFRVHGLGCLHDDLSMALAYNAADVFVAPSLQDNLPLTVMEALSCGLPCVAFNIGGMPDMIRSMQNGYLATLYDVEDLTRGIAWVLEDKDRHVQLASTARRLAVEEFSLEIQAQRYLDLFQELIEKK
jgi:glycosyltransferase involved in cell wall biosynthesis